MPAKIRFLLLAGLLIFGIAQPALATEQMKKHLAEVGNFAKQLPAARISSKYGMRTLGGVTRFHSGIDIAVAGGTPVKPLLAGIVIRAGWHGEYGNMVEVYHGSGITTRYAHLSQISAKLGKYVTKTASIGKVGSTGRSTGNHLHFEIRNRGKALDPMLLAGKKL